MAKKEVMHVPTLIKNAADMPIVELLDTVSKTAEAVAMNLKKLDILRAELKARGLDQAAHGTSISWTITDEEERD